MFDAEELETAAELEEGLLEEDTAAELLETLTELEETLLELEEGLLEEERAAELEELTLRKGLVNLGAPGTLKSTALFTALCEAI